MAKMVCRIGTVFEFGDIFCFTDYLSGFLFRVRVRVSPFRVKFGVGVVSGLGLGLGLALGLGEGWVLHISTRIYSNQSFAQARKPPQKKTKDLYHIGKNFR